MSKPDDIQQDIPQSVWNQGAALAGQCVGLLNSGSVSERTVTEMADLLARAIMAEAERIAAMAEEFGKVAAEPALFTFAEIIREQLEPPA